MSGVPHNGLRHPLFRSAWSALLLGVISAGGFAPLGAFPLLLLAVTGLLALWRGQNPKRAAWLGFVFGLGQFLAGVSWLYVALHDVGGMPMPLSALAIFLFCCVLAVFPMLAGWLVGRFANAGDATCDALRYALVAASAWLLTEWLRSWVLTGFPWLSLGYAHVLPSPLAGFAPISGVHGVSALSVLWSATLLFVMQERKWPWALGFVGLPVLGYVLSWVSWTAPIGEPFSVRLVQTNIPQTLKWQPELLPRWLEKNLRLANQGEAVLTVLPETTLPLLEDDLPENYMASMREYARGHEGDVVLGMFVREDTGAIHNAALSQGTNGEQRYAKAHLVPFGEYVPPAFDWVFKWLNMPMSDQMPGAANQPLMKFGQQRVAVNICYESVFGNEIAARAGDATLLLNMSNLAWYGHSSAQPQHLQIAQMRALETGRPLLQATNTGATAVVDAQGRVTAELPSFADGALLAQVRGTQGLTPYVRWGNTPVVVLAIVGLWWGCRRRARVG